MWKRRLNVECICSINSPILRNFRLGCTVHNLGQTRSSQRSNHFLWTADTFVRTTLPGMKGCTAIVHAGPAIGARFAQYTAEFESAGELGDTSAQRFLFVLEGQLKVEIGGRPSDLHRRGYAYFPEGCPRRVARKRVSGLAVLEKPYQPVASVEPPRAIVSREEAV